MAKPVSSDVEYFKHGIYKRSPTNPLKTLLCPIVKLLKTKSALVGGIIGTKIGLPIAAINGGLLTLPKALPKAKKIGKTHAMVLCALG